MFKLDTDQITRGGVHLTGAALAALPAIEQAINDCFVAAGETPVQRGRVVALRHTDKGGLSSAFSAALYLGKYTDATNRGRLWKMIDAGHSYEPLRGESVSFLFIGVGKPTYDHLVTYTIRQRRVCGGMRANPPWGFVVPYEAKDKDRLARMAADDLGRYDALVQAGEQPQAARSVLPAGIVLPPFQLDFSEEALAKNIFKQRVWQLGAQGETVEIVADMLECCKAIDTEKWAALTAATIEPLQHHRVMRNMRKEAPETYSMMIGAFDRPEKTMWSM